MSSLPNDTKHKAEGSSLTARILIGIAVGVVLGVALKERAAAFKPLGDIFISLLKMIIAPLMLCAIVSGVASLGSLVKLGRLGGKALLWYTTTGTLAILNGLVMVNTIGPGRNSGLKIAEDATAKYEGYKAPSVVDDVLMKIVPDNIVKALAEGQVLSILFFGALMGAALTAIGDEGKPMMGFIEAFYKALMKLVEWVMLVAPFGIAALVAGIVGTTGAAVIVPLMKYIATVMLGLAVHWVVLLTIFVLMVKKNPFAYVAQIAPALTTAFGTASSAATLPVTYECLVNKAGISPRIASFFLPISSMVNSDGTAVYEAVAAVFIAQVVGVDLTIAQQVAVFLAAMAASIGAPGIPSAGMVTLVMVLNAVKLPVAGIALLAPVDRLLDQSRTMTNILGDCVGVAIIDKSEVEK